MSLPAQSPSRVGDMLSSVLQRVDPEQHPHAYRIWDVWDTVVGATIARRARPVRFRNGQLSVSVATHSWMQELQFMKAEIRERLNLQLGGPVIRTIVLEIGEVDLIEAEAVAERPLPSMLREDAALPPIDDPTLAGAFARLVDARRARQTRAPTRPTAPARAAPGERRR